MNEWRNEWIKEWMNEWRNEWIYEWMNEWMNEWINEQVAGHGSHDAKQAILTGKNGCILKPIQVKSWI